MVNMSYIFSCVFGLVHLQIEENSRRLRTGDLGIPINPADRFVMLRTTFPGVCVCCNCLLNANLYFFSTSNCNIKMVASCVLFLGLLLQSQFTVMMERG